MNHSKVEDAGIRGPQDSERLWRIIYSQPVYGGAISAKTADGRDELFDRAGAVAEGERMIKAGVAASYIVEFGS